MVTMYGMSEAIGPRYLDHDDRQPFLGAELAAPNRPSPETARLIDAEVANILDRGWKVATGAIESEWAAHGRLVEALLEHETLESEALAALVGPPSSGPRASEPAGEPARSSTG